MMQTDFYYLGNDQNISFVLLLCSAVLIVWNFRNSFLSLIIKVKTEMFYYCYHCFLWSLRYCYQIWLGPKWSQKRRLLQNKSLHINPNVKNEWLLENKLSKLPFRSISFPDSSKTFLTIFYHQFHVTVEDEEVLD